MEAGDLGAALPLQLIRELYDVERVASERGLDAAGRQKLREAESRPRMQKLRAHIDSPRGDTYLVAPSGW